MKKVFLIVVLFLCGYLYEVNYDYILVVDISGSMREGKLHERVKKAFKEYVSGVQIGDRVIIMTFGNDVNPGLVDVTIQGMGDIRNIQQEIDKFEFNDQYTWMTKAFDVIGNRLRDLQRAYPERPKKVLIFTDGKNEPPPGHEDEFTFGYIMRRHFETYDTLNTFVYVVLLGEKPQEELKRMEEERMIKIIEKERDVPHPVQEVDLSPQSFFMSLLLKDTIEEKVELKVERLVNITQEVPIGLELEGNKEFQIDLSPTQFGVNNEGQIIPLTLTLIGIKKAGSYSFSVYPKTSMEGIIVSPNRIVFNINVIETTIPFAEFYPPSFDLEFNLKDSVEKKIKLKVKKLSGTNIIPITLKVDTNPYLKVKISPTRFVANEIGQEIPITLTITGIKSVGRYSLSLYPVDTVKKAVIQPSQIPLKINIIKPIFPDWGYIVGIGIAMGLITGYVVYRLKREKLSGTLYQLDKAGNTIQSFDLSEYNTNKVSPKSLGLSGELSDKAFLIYIKNGIFYLKAGSLEEIRIQGSQEPLKPNEKVEIFNGTVFEVSGLRFRFEESHEEIYGEETNEEKT